MSDTSTSSTTTAKRAARARTAKASAPRKRPAARSAARPPAAKPSKQAKPSKSAPTAGSKYLSAVLARTADQAEEWDAAGRAFGEELRAVQTRAAGQLPQDSYAQRLAVAAPTDVAGLLQVHQNYLDEINRAAETLNAGYEKAVAAYTKKIQALWDDSRQRAADDFADYVDALRRELASTSTDADPESLATLGTALIAMSQLAGAVRRS